jgi:hypothetical protein
MKTLQDILMENSENTIIDASGIEWSGYGLEQEFISTSEEGITDLEKDAVVGENGRIWFLDENGNRIESGFTIL